MMDAKQLSSIAAGIELAFENDRPCPLCALVDECGEGRTLEGFCPTGVALFIKRAAGNRECTSSKPVSVITGNTYGKLSKEVARNIAKRTDDFLRLIDELESPSCVILREQTQAINRFCTAGSGMYASAVRSMIRTYIIKLRPDLEKRISPTNYNISNWEDYIDEETLEKARLSLDYKRQAVFER